MRILRRVLLMVFIIWIAASINFLMPRLSDRNPVEEVIAASMGESGGTMEGFEEAVADFERRFGMDQPVWKQYLNSIYDALTFDLGMSISYFPDRVSTLVLQAAPWTLGIMLTTTLLAFVIGTPLGALTVWDRAPRWINVIVPIVMILAAIPFYLIGLILIYVFASRLNWLPTGKGYSSGMIPEWSWDFAGNVMTHALLPGLSILLASVGIWALSMRGMMVTVQGEDYMVFAKAKGLTGKRRFWRYGVRNAVAPQITALVLTLANVVTGAVLVERVFAYPGLGNLLYQAILVNDYYLIFGCVYMLVLTVGISLMFLDLVYPLIDPRIRADANG
ncbi:MAG: ABC transporter permease [Pseudomonadota bacterium]